MTKQGTAPWGKELVDQGYVVRLPHPYDARVRLLGLAEAGRAAVAPWRQALGEARFGALAADLARITRQGPVRPTW